MRAPFKALVFWLGFPAALVAGVTAAYAALDWLGVRPVLSREFAALTEQVASNTQSIQLVQWQRLNEKRKNQGLSPEELLIFCKLSKLLGFRVDVCN